PRGKPQWVVPGNDLGGHAERLAKREVDEAFSEGNARAEDLVGNAGEVFEVAGGRRDVVFRLAQGLADIEALQLGQLPAVLAEDLGEPVQESNATYRRYPRPSPHPRLGRRRRRVDVSFLAQLHPGQYLGGRP